jgi:antitoxin component of MazEF toxin-antitoxin module
MEEVIGSIPICSTRNYYQIRKSQSLRFSLFLAIGVSVAKFGSLMAYLHLTCPSPCIYNVTIMNTYTATVIKTGNSVALRVPKQYADAAKLVPGDKVNLQLPSKQKQQDRAKVKRIVEKLQALHAYESMGDPTAWQREVRQDRPLPGRQ